MPLALLALAVAAFGIGTTNMPRKATLLAALFFIYLQRRETSTVNVPN